MLIKLIDGEVNALKKKIISALSVFLMILLTFTNSVTAFAKVTSVSISGSSSLKAGNSYSYSASATLTNNTKISSYKWHLYGGHGVFLSQSGKTCRLNLSRAASGSGSLVVVVTGSDGTTASREIGFNITAAPKTTKKQTTRKQTTKRQTTKKRSTTKRKQTPKPKTTKKQTTRHATKPSTTHKFTTQPKTTTQRLVTETTTVPNTTTTASSEEDTQSGTSMGTTQSTTATKHPALVGNVNVECSVTDNEANLKWNKLNCEKYNVYLKSEDNYILIYSGTANSYRCNNLIPGTTYKVIVESVDSTKTIKSKEASFDVPKLSVWQQISKLFSR